MFANSAGQPVPGADTHTHTHTDDVTVKLQISSSRHFCHLFVMYLFIYLEVFSPRENVWNKISMRILLEKKTHTQAQKDRRGKEERVYAQHLLIVPNLINRIECVCD